MHLKSSRETLIGKQEMGRKFYRREERNKKPFAYSLRLRTKQNYLPIAKKPKD